MLTGKFLKCVRMVTFDGFTYELYQHKPNQHGKEILVRRFGPKNNHYHILSVSKIAGSARRKCNKNAKKGFQLVFNW